MSQNYQIPHLAKDFYEYQKGNCDISVVGSLAKRGEFWRHMNAPEHIIRIVEHGYTIPLKSLPDKNV